MIKLLSHLKSFILIAVTVLGIIMVSVTPSYAGTKNCSLKTMQEKYMGEDAAESCWYCKIVVIMTNAYLAAAQKAISVSQTLGRTILKIGFLLWLALYILQQVSATNPTSPGKFLQEILVMGFKVAFAYAAVDQGFEFFRDYIVTPIMLTGIDYGQALLDGLMDYAG
jgi:hypothetical protein